jgi:uncharacterized Zn-finger protein
MLNPSLAANETLFLALYATLSKKDIPQLSPTGAACLYLTPCHALTKRSIIMKHTDLQARNNSSIAGQEVRLDGEHLRCDTGSEAIDLPRVLLDLPRVEQSLQPARLLGQLEQPLPLVLWEQWLL